MLRCSRYLILVMGTLLSMLCSVNYAFGLWSQYLKTSPALCFKQSQVDSIGMWGNIGQYLGLLAGIIYDRYGPRATLLVGASLGSGGYLLLFLALHGVIPASDWLLSVFYAIGSNAQPFFDTTSLCTNIANFPEARGLVIGLTKVFNGLGAGVYVEESSSSSARGVLLCALRAMRVVRCGVFARTHPVAITHTPHVTNEARLCLLLPRFFLRYASIFKGFFSPDVVHFIFFLCSLATRTYKSLLENTGD